MIIFPLCAQSRVGVGAGTGKINLGIKLLPGETYDLPTIIFANTGNEKSEYKISLQKTAEVGKINLPEEWIQFEPKRFTLAPKESQIVKIKIRLPINIDSGEYLGYIKCSPVSSEASIGNTSIGIAAATKITFTILPKNIWQKTTQKASIFWKKYSILVFIASILIVIAIILIFFRKTFRLNFKLEKKK